jgi:hypothetical protein
MGKIEDPFEQIAAEGAMRPRSALRANQAPGAPSTGAVTARLHGFDLDDQPLVSGLTQLPGEIVAARAAVALRQQMIGEEVVVLFDGGDVHRPIIVGVLESRSFRVETVAPAQQFSVQADDDRFVVTAEREIVLRCGDASITLTRAGKVIIKGNYVLSRSSGYNKIKGAAVDIN